MSKRKNPTLLFTITSNQSGSKFGQSIAVSDFYGTGDPIIAVSSPTEVCLSAFPYILEINKSRA